MTHLDVLLREFYRHPFEPTEAANEGAPTDTEALIAHILERYHATHRREFPEAIRLARRVEATHAGHPACPRGLADHLAFMADDLEGHQQKEERALFPMLINGGGPGARFPILKMTAEHRDVDEQLATLSALTSGFAAPAGACRSWSALYSACRKIHDDLIAHMKLEEGTLFARFIP